MLVTVSHAITSRPLLVDPCCVLTRTSVMLSLKISCSVTKLHHIARYSISNILLLIAKLIIGMISPSFGNTYSRNVWVSKTLLKLRFLLQRQLLTLRRTERRWQRSFSRLLILMAACSNLKPCSHSCAKVTEPESSWTQVMVCLTSFQL